MIPLAELDCFCNAESITLRSAIITSSFSVTTLVWAVECPLNAFVCCLMSLLHTQQPPELLPWTAWRASTIAEFLALSVWRASTIAAVPASSSDFPASLVLIIMLLFCTASSRNHLRHSHPHEL